MPLVFAMVLTVALMGAIVIEAMQARLLEKKSKAIARALATEIARAAQSADHPEQAPVRLTARRLESLALGNGYDPSRFHPIGADDIAAGRDWARVTVRPRHRGVRPQSATVHVVFADAQKSGAHGEGNRTERIE